MGKGKRVENTVPCNGCTECCRNELVFLHPECGDRASFYETQVVAGKYALAQKPNGDCIYLDRVFGCRIHSNKPAVCAEMDCVVFLALLPTRVAKLMSTGHLRQTQLVAADRRLKRAPDPRGLLARARKLLGQDNEEGAQKA